jgi:uncharacterized BrkB/YihY/UPF0761 family membrane protein
MPAFVDEWKGRIDRFQRAHAVVGFPFAVVRKNGDDKGGQLAALITYYGFFSLFPLLLVGFTILGFVLDGNPRLQDDVADTLQSWLPIPGIEARTLNGSGWALLVGIVLTLWAGLGATQMAQDAVNTVWDVTRKEQPSFFVKRLRGLAIFAVMGVGLIVATVASSMAAIFGVAAGVVGFAGSVVINAALVAALFKLTAETSLGWKDLRWGALFGGVGWAVLQLIGAWYTDRLVGNANKTYGTFAVVIGLLSWIFLQSQVFVYAAEVSTVASRHLWPRSLVTEDPTDADREVADLLAARSRLS